MNHPEITFLIEAGHIRDDRRIQTAFINLLKLLVKTDAWVWLPVREQNGGNYAHCIVQMDDEDYVVMFSEDILIKTEESVSIASTSIGKIIEVVLYEDNLAGVIINPFTPQYRGIVSKKELRSILELE